MDNVFIGLDSGIAGTALKLEGVWVDTFKNMYIYAREHVVTAGSLGV